MRDTIKAKERYWIGSNQMIKYEYGNDARALLDGQNVVMICIKQPLEVYEYNRRENECFEKCEVFTTDNGKQYIYWRDNELDEDYITLIGENQ